MADIRSVTADFAVAPQLEPEDMADAARRGFTLIINNRPDGEAPGQPTAEAMRQAAEAAGLAYVHIPVRGGPTPDQIASVLGVVDGAQGPVLAFCRSGTRSIVTWSLGRAQGGSAREDLVDLAREAGYDLSGVLL
jgi:uncharacterized protein (TIGR01244 family)